MKLLQRTIKKLKYFVLIINYKLFAQKKNKGYNNLALNKSIVKKTIIYSKLKSKNDHNINWHRTIKFLKFLKKKKIKKIIDFGGGAGYHFFVAKILFPNLNLKWSIVENQIMVKLCNKKIKNKNLFFFNSLNQIKKADILGVCFFFIVMKLIY